MAYLPNAPPAFIKLYEERSQVTGQFVRSATRPLLLKLLSDTRRKRAWNTIAKSLKPGEAYKKLFKAIVEARRLARHGITSPVARKERYKKDRPIGVGACHINSGISEAFKR